MSKRIPEIVIRFIDHLEQRYETCGDYFEEPDGQWIINVSDLGDDYENVLVAMHELVELMLCRKRGIAEPIVKAFDERFEALRDAGKVPEDAEPGDAPDAPYKREHRFAENVERQLALELGVDWDKYEQKVMAL